jgi:hypothetical protein
MANAWRQAINARLRRCWRRKFSRVYSNRQATFEEDDDRAQPAAMARESERKLRLPVVGQQRREDQRAAVVVRQGLPEQRLDFREQRLVCKLRRARRSQPGT